MDPALKIAVVFILLGFVNASFSDYDYGHCERVVQNWAFSSLDQEVKEDKHTLQDLLFFLHVPRTGGRTYFHCFLKKLYPNSLECPRSYDKLRFDPSKQKCKLLATHDDYSVTSKLPREKTSVVTILRNPIDRVFSSYEFSIEVAARFLVHPNLSSVAQMSGRLRSKSKGVSTLDIWPWKYLVPWMREDLFARRDARKQMGVTDVTGNDPYNMEEVAMPLEDYINDPIAMEIIHNGATFQVAGLTNNSYLPESHEVRNCVQKFKVLGDYVLKVAKKRLDEMLYVGLTEKHKESANMFGSVVGAQVISQMVSSKSFMEAQSSNKSGNSSSFTDSEPDGNYQPNSASDKKASEISSSEDAEGIKENMTVGKLMNAYETCISTLRKSQAGRRVNSLKRIAPANFTKEARLQVPDLVLQQIRELNNLDIELYKYAEDIFAKQSEHTMRKLTTEEKLESMLKDSYGVTLWQAVLIAMIVSLVLLAMFFFLFVNARRRTSKVKI